MEGLAELQARESELEREWTWLQQTLNAVAQARADQEDATAFRRLQDQAMAVGQRRVEVALRMSALGWRGP
jgi:hypothetical protein